MINVTDASGKFHTPTELSIQAEPEMSSHSGLYQFTDIHIAHRELLESVMTQAFLAQPIIGNISITGEQHERIHMLAERTLSNARRMTHLNNMGLDSFTSDVIVLATVLALRKWNESASDGSGTFWEYIFNQFALPFEYGNYANCSEYKIFREAIHSSLLRHKRLEARDGKKTYASLLIHSFSPKLKFFDLFEQVFSFYVKNLNYHYLPLDPALLTFTYAMKDRFEFVKSRYNDDVYIKSLQSNIAIKHLFMRSPVYMSHLVERVVRQMDSLVATGTLGNQENDYIDDLLMGWYDKRSRAERTSDKRRRTEASSERVVTDFAHIRLSYSFENGKLYIVIPAIRLGEEQDEKPQLTVFRCEDDTNPYIVDMRYYGNYICITSSKMEIPIEPLMQNVDTRGFDLRFAISYGGKDIFDSGTKYFREAIIFCDNGAEVSKRPENEYINILAKRNCTVDGLETAMDYTAKPCDSLLLYRVLIDRTTAITINGEPLYPVEQVVSDMTLRTLVSPVNHCKYVVNSYEYFIFARQPILEILSDAPNFEKQYRIAIDNGIGSFSEHLVASSNSYKIHLPCDKGAHSFRIIDNTSHQRIYELSYIVLLDFSLDFDGFYFAENHLLNGTLSIQAGGETTTSPYAIDTGQQNMLVPFEGGDLSVDIPILEYLLDGTKLSKSVNLMFWHTDIPAHALLEIVVPRGFSATTLIGNSLFEEDRIEIGNIIRSNHELPIETVEVIVRGEGYQPLDIKLFDIAFEAFFQTPPLHIENNELWWLVENNFIGDASTNFEVRILYKGYDYGCYKFTSEDDIVFLDGDFPSGVFHFEIYAKQPGFFSKYELLASERFVNGEPDKFRFDDCAVIITEAISENERISLNQYSGIVKDLRYIGEQYLNGETQHYPCYEGKLFYKHNGQLRLYATADYERNGKFHEQINPVKLWVINEFTISLRTPADDGLYVHKGWRSITDRKPPTRAMGLSAENWQIADYYHFNVIPQSEVENV